MYAIIEDSGTQIKVSEGDIIKVALRDLPENAINVTFDRVLAIGQVEEGSEAQIGTPLLAGAKVTADILAQERGEKVYHVRFRRRKNVHRKRGHRQDHLKVKITSIQA